MGRIFGPKKNSVFRICGSSAFAEGKKLKKRLTGVGLKLRNSDLLTTALPTTPPHPPWMIIKLTYIRNKQIILFELEKKV